MFDIDVFGQYLMIITGIILFIFGSIGNILNILVFSIWSRVPKTGSGNNNVGRASNTPIYLFVSSCSNLIVIIYPLLTRIMFDGFRLSPTYSTVFILCKFRYYILFTFDFISLTNICLALLDRYFVSSSDVRLRRLSTQRKRTKQVIFLISLIFFLHNIPLCIYFEGSTGGQCVVNSPVYNYYYLYVFQILFHGLIPISFLSVFGILTYKQMKIVKKRSSISGSLNIDKQASRMILLLSFAAIISGIPYSVVQMLDRIFNYHNDVDRSSPIFLFNIISNILFYTHPVSSFYIYYFSTPNFRIQIRNIFAWKQPIRRLTFSNNQVAIIQLNN